MRKSDVRFLGEGMEVTPEPYPTDSESYAVRLLIYLLNFLSGIDLGILWQA